MPLVPKGQSVLLSKEASAPTVKKFQAGAGWDPNGDKAVDLDLVAIKLSGGKGFDADGNGKSEVNEAVTYYGNMQTPGLKLDKDDLTGESSGDGPDETMDIDLTAVEAGVDEILIVVASYSGQTFDEVSNVFASLSEGDKEVVRADLAAEHAGKGAVVVAKLTRTGDDWNFTHVGEGYANSDEILSKYSIV
jgi:stress response protein SCP2